MDLIDLHVHSTASDGTLTPSEVVIFAKRIGLKSIALTDHDTVSAIQEALDAAKENNIELIPGIEISCAYHEKEIHIVGLFIDPLSDILLSRLKELIITRDKRNEIMAEKFQNLGIPIEFEDIKKTYPDSVITRAHFASYLHKKGYVGSVREAFDRYLSDHGPCYVPRERLDCVEAIELIHSAGGVAILAHPILYKMGNEQLDKMVGYLHKFSLDGIEAIYSTYTNSDERYIRLLAKKYNLLISGGSDFHGSNKPYIQLGSGKGKLKVPKEILDNIRQRLK